MSRISGSRITLIILFAVSLSSCKSYGKIPRELQDLSILTDQPCKAPCWYNVTPDQSSEQEARDVLKALPFIDPVTIRSQNTSWWGVTPKESAPATWILANCVQPSDQICVEILAVEGKVKHIMLFPNYELTFDQVVEHLGDPNHIDVRPYGAECLGCTLGFSWLQPPLEISMIYVDRRCSAGYKICEAIRDGGRIPRDLQVEKIIYQGSIPPYAQTQDFDKPWPGFTLP